jgi:hypothetical protein
VSKALAQKQVILTQSDSESSALLPESLCILQEINQNIIVLQSSLYFYIHILDAIENYETGKETEDTDQ